MKNFLFISLIAFSGVFYSQEKLDFNHNIIATISGASSQYTSGGLTERDKKPTASFGYQLDIDYSYFTFGALTGVSFDPSFYSYVTGGLVLTTVKREKYMYSDKLYIRGGIGIYNYDKTYGRSDFSGFMVDVSYRFEQLSVGVLYTDNSYLSDGYENHTRIQTLGFKLGYNLGGN